MHNTHENITVIAYLKLIFNWIQLIIQFLENFTTLNTYLMHTKPMQKITKTMTATKRNTQNVLTIFTLYSVTVVMSWMTTKDDPNSRPRKREQFDLIRCINDSITTIAPKLEHYLQGPQQPKSKYKRKHSRRGHTPRHNIQTMAILVTVLQATTHTTR